MDAPDIELCGCLKTELREYFFPPRSQQSEYF